MKLKAFVGAGDRIVALTLPFAAIGLAANILWPSVFHMGTETAGLAAGVVLLVVGVPLWLVSVAQILSLASRGNLITTGPFALLAHPIYTSVGLLVLPGLGLLLDTWLCPALGVILYLASRIFSGSEERDLAERFPGDYASYRAQVRFPWL